MIFLIKTLARFSFEQVAGLKQVFESVDGQEMENWMLKPDSPEQELCSMISFVYHQIVFTDIVPQFSIEGHTELCVVAPEFR